MAGSTRLVVINRIRPGRATGAALAALFGLAFAVPGCGGGGGATTPPAIPAVNNVLPTVRLAGSANAATFSAGTPPTGSSAAPTATATAVSAAPGSTILVKVHCPAPVDSILVAIQGASGFYTIPVGASRQQGDPDYDLDIDIGPSQSLQSMTQLLLQIITVTGGQASQPLTVTVNLAPGAPSIRILPSAPTIVLGQTARITATELDASGNPVSGSPTLEFSSAGPSIVSVDQTGLLTALATGSATVAVGDPVTDAASVVVVTVTSPVSSMSISPISPAVFASATQQFTANVVGPTNTGVAWSIQEGAAGGTITPTGLYTAPAVAGTYHVVATSQADPTVSASTNIVVTVATVGTIGGNIQ